MQALVLGTAQFGAGYGVTNAKGRLTDAELADIMGVAQGHGIRAVDTAAGYGDAQTRLRLWAPDLVITTKIPGSSPADVRHHLEVSLGELGVDRVDSCLVHDWHELTGGQRRAVASAMSQARSEGIVQDVGVSAYEEPDVVSAVECFAQLDLIQVPANALDRRLDESLVLARLAREGARIQVRSVFLQGLLAGPSSTVQGQHPAVRAFLQWCATNGSAPLATALAHARALSWATEIVVGVTSPVELDQVLDGWAHQAPQLAPQSLACDDLSLIDPRRWGS